MAQYKVVIDLGSQYISAGIVNDISVKMPAVVAVEEGETKQVVAVGVNALNYSRVEAKNVRLVHPILEGAVIDADNAKVLIQELLSRVLPNKAKIFASMKVCVVVPCGLISSDKKIIENILLSIGAKSVYFVTTPIADSNYCFREFHTNRALVANIGAECTDMAVVYGDQIVAGCTLFHAGKSLTQEIAEFVRRKYLVQISLDQAENFKTSCASLYVNDLATYNVSGTNIQTGKFENLNISAKEAYDAVAEHSKTFVKVAESLLNSVPEHVASAIHQQGIILCGGGANLSGIDAYITEQTGLPCKIAKDPQEVSISGGCMYFEKVEG